MPADIPQPPTVYRVLARIAVPLVGPFLSRGAAAKAHRGRLAAPDQIEKWGVEHRDPSRSLAWFHAASAGESLQAAVVIGEFRTLRPEWQVVATHFSASAERLRERMAADLVEYAPYDREEDVARALAALKPDLLVFTKLDLWPELATAAARAGVHCALVAGTVDAGSSRLHWPARALTHAGYRALDRVGAITADDGMRLEALGVRPERIEVTGDPRVDSVLQRLAGETAEPPPRDPNLLVAGSTWRGDEALLLEAFKEVRVAHPRARLWLVPHEPDEAARAAIIRKAHELGLPEPESCAGDGPLGVVTQMGVLAGLYGRGGIAYVGGGFGTRGVHSVLEPAAHSVPILIGPNDRGLRDAALLAATGGLNRLPAGGATETLVERWSAWLADPADAARRGAAARAALSADQGAAGRSAGLLADLLG